MDLEIIPSGSACGASVLGVDLGQDLSDEQVANIRAAWLEYHVLIFPDQKLSDDELVQVANLFGSIGDDPFFVPIEGNDHVVALTRRADETAPVFAETWHTDWSFKTQPPIGTCLYALTVPPVGGDTSFLNQQKALAEMPEDLREKLAGRRAIHSAAGAYAPDGAYGAPDEGSDRSMQIITNDSAYETETHPFVVKHPESGVDTLFGTAGYIIGCEGMADEEAKALVMELYAWQTRPEFQYHHKWEPGMLVLWDNRSVLHKANGGYDGHARELHRVTIAGAPGLSV